jgi:protein-tyrosine phosphatase
VAAAGAGGLPVELVDLPDAHHAFDTVDDTEPPAPPSAGSSGSCAGTSLTAGRLASTSCEREGFVTTEQREWTRLLEWEGCLNARDLGGYATEGGRETRWGAVVRSDSPAALTEAGRAALADYGVRAIVDLRLADEIERDPNPFAEPGDHGIAYTNISVIDPAAGFPPDTSTLAENYLWMLDRFRGFVAEVMAAIAGAPDGAVVIHCAAGKDRTGLISALLLGLVDVPAETIAADYAITAELLAPREQEWLEASPPEERAEREAMISRYAPTAEVMLGVLEGLTERYGGVEPYLLEAGVSRPDLERLRERLLAPPAGERA